MLRKCIWVLSTLLLTAGLAGCGGGGGGSMITPVTQQSPTVGAGATVALLASNSTLPTDGTSKVTLTATVKDPATNAAVEKATVYFSATSGTLSVASAVTDASGNAPVVLTTNNDKSPRDIVVTARVTNGGSATNRVTVSGTTLKWGGPSSAVVNQPVTLTVTLIDANNSPVVGASVSVRSSLNTTYRSDPALVTDSSGVATFSYPAATTGADVLTVTALGMSKQTTLNVSGVSLNFTAPVPAAGSSTVVLEEGGSCSANAVSAQLVGGADTALVFSTTRGLLYANSACTTGSAVLSVPITGSSIATVYAKSTSAGTGTITVQAPTSVASTALKVTFASKVASKVTIQGQPSTVVVGSQSNLTAYVQDATGNPVMGKTVYFVAPAGGGTISPGYATTDSSGVASAVFTADANLSGLGAVTIQAVVQEGGTTVTGSSSFTVAGQSVQVNLSTDNLVIDSSAGFEGRYRQLWLVTVRDSNGSPIQNQLVTISLGFPNYQKGHWELDSEDTPTKWKRIDIPVPCPADDTNGDGLIDGNEKDINNIGVLDPNSSGVVIPVNATATTDKQHIVSVTTDVAGVAQFWVANAKEEAGWTQFRLTASAVVNGTNNANTRIFWSLIPAAVLKNLTTPPPFQYSPFGNNLSCDTPN